ncbi:serine hydrolase [bacterium]|nr:serine hydrolase [bacterium]
MNKLEKSLHKKFEILSPQTTPGFVLQAYQKGQKICDLRWGKTWHYYDLASLTKIFFTVPWMIRTVHLNQIDLFKQYNKYVSWYPHSLVIKDLLSHSAGNDWWQPFYKMLPQEAITEEKKTSLKLKLREMAPSVKKDKAVYSDIDFLLLGFLLETVFEKTWLELWQDMQNVVFKKEEMFFQPFNQLKFSVDKYAPTENCPWRKRILQGEVHDENAWALDGVAPHAGLFGSINAVSEWAQWFRNEFYGKKSLWLDSPLVQKFTERCFPATKGDWSLGFMLPTEGSASCGKYFSPKSFGHTGFTGTSFWMDPEKDLMVILLSNRIHPTRNNELFKKARPQIHDWICEELGET